MKNRKNSADKKREYHRRTPNTVKTAKSEKSNDSGTGAVRFEPRPARKEWMTEPSGIYESAIDTYNLSSEFSQEALDEAEERARGTISKRVIEQRTDLRDMMIFTIDGADAKDFDDAVSIEILEDATRLGVHIADVSVYVAMRGEVNREAYKRGTSVYMAGKVLPMLPEALSNGICSLNPGVDRLTLSLFMDIDGEGHVIDYRFMKAVIRSKARLCYENVNKMLGGDAAELREMEALGVAEPLMEMVALAEILRGRRYRRGAISFDLPESIIELNESGYPVSVGVREHGVSNELIEEFMLIANEITAAHALRHRLPFIYRVHERPSDQKMTDFSIFINNYGFNLPRKVKPRTLQRMLKKVQGHPGEAVISHFLLRAMQKARYDVEPIGHFGLACADYCHFTSPIRRYPDLMIHRILSKHLDKTITPKVKTSMERLLPDIAAHTSNCERTAMDAERDVDAAFMALYMKDHVGESYDGTITGINSFGFFVMLDNTIEGLVRLPNLPVFLNFNKLTNALSDNTGEYVFRVGDPVSVRVLASDVALRRIDFLLEGIFTYEMYEGAIRKKSSLRELMVNPVFIAMYGQ